MRKYNFYLSEQALFPLYACPECDRELTVVAYNTSSVWEEVNRLGQKVTWAPGHEDSQWAASSGDQQPWMELELWNRSSVTGQPLIIILQTSAVILVQKQMLQKHKEKKNVLHLLSGIITKGTPHYYIESYTLMFSKDSKNWKVYKAASSKEIKVRIAIYTYTHTHI